MHCIITVKSITFRIFLASHWRLGSWVAFWGYYSQHCRSGVSFSVIGVRLRGGLLVGWGQRYGAWHVTTQRHHACGTTQQFIYSSYMFRVPPWKRRINGWHRSLWRSLFMRRVSWSFPKGRDRFGMAFKCSCDQAYELNLGLWSGIIRSKLFSNRTLYTDHHPTLLNISFDIYQRTGCLYSGPSLLWESRVWLIMQMRLVGTPLAYKNPARPSQALRQSLLPSSATSGPWQVMLRHRAKCTQFQGVGHWKV